MTGSHLDALLYALGLATTLIIFLPFSPMTIDLVNLARASQIAIYRHRLLLWLIAATCFGAVTLRGLMGLFVLHAGLGPLDRQYALLAATDATWLVTTAVTLAVLIVLFWSGYVPYVMAPPSRHRAVTAAQADAYLASDDVVLGLVCGNEVRAYPRDTIARPHYFTDTLAGTPMMISYCILCNSAIAFKAELDGRRLELKCVTAFNNNIIYYEPSTGNFIQQLDGRVIDGPDAGKTLHPYPVALSTWANWKQLYPETTLYHAPAITLRDRMVARMLQAMIPIAKLSKRSGPWHRIQGELDQRLPAMSLVIGVEIDNDSCGYPVEALRGSRVLDDEVGGKPITLFYDAGHELGQVFSRQVDSRVLTFVPAVRPGMPVVARDRETGSLWTVTGKALEGPLLGQSLEAVPHVNKLFWFSWALFKPRTRVGTPALAAAGALRPSLQP